MDTTTTRRQLRQAQGPDTRATRRARRETGGAAGHGRHDAGAPQSPRYADRVAAGRADLTVGAAALTHQARQGEDHDPLAGEPWAQNYQAWEEVPTASGPSRRDRATRRGAARSAATATPIAVAEPVAVPGHDSRGGTSRTGATDAREDEALGEPTTSRSGVARTERRTQDRSLLRRNLLLGMGTLSLVAWGLSYHTSLAGADEARPGPHEAGSPAATARGGATGSAVSADNPPRPTATSGAAPSRGPVTPGTKQPQAPGGGAATATASGSAAPRPSGGAAGQSVPSAGNDAPGGFKDGTFTGRAVGTDWGDVQVQLTIADGRITASHAIVSPHKVPHSAEITDAVVPKYDAAVVAAQSARIDSVSGATVTWSGYTASVQSALDQARA